MWAFSALSVHAFGEAAVKNQLGVRLPVAVMAGLDDSKEFLLLIPVVSTTPGAYELTHHNGQAKVNLVELFAPTDRLVPEGVNEYYTVHAGEEEFEVDGVKGWGVYIHLPEVEVVSVRRLTPEQKAKRAAKKKSPTPPTKEGNATT